MTTKEKLDTVLADELLPAGSKALYLQLVQHGGQGTFAIFSSNNSDKPGDLQTYAKRLVGRKYVEMYRDEYRVV